MRCYACNVALSNVESTRRFVSGEFTDLCTRCLNTLDDVETIDSDVVDEQEKEDGEE